jgi:hypothetical protein
LIFYNHDCTANLLFILIKVHRELFPWTSYTPLTMWVGHVKHFSSFFSLSPNFFKKHQRATVRKFPIIIHKIKITKSINYRPNAHCDTLFSLLAVFMSPASLSWFNCSEKGSINLASNHKHFCLLPTSAHKFSQEKIIFFGNSLKLPLSRPSK